MLTGLGAETETLLAAPFNPLLSTHFWATAGAGTIVLTALSSSVNKGNYIQKWNESACGQNAPKTLCILYVRVQTCTCVWLCLYVCEWLYAFKRLNRRTLMPGSVLVRKYADSEELAPWILFLQQSAHHCFNHKSLRINPQWPYCRAKRGFLSQWLTVIIIEREWA